MKKRILTFGLVAALAIPAATALAADDTDDPVVPTVAAQEQVREQARVHEPGEYTGEAIQERKQLRIHIDDPAYAEVRAQNQSARQAEGTGGFGKGMANGGQGGQYGMAGQGGPGGQGAMAGQGQGLGLHDGSCINDGS